MKIITKDAEIENTGEDDAFPGTFRVVLSTADEDRDGDELLADDWEQPLPEHITFDQDHGMTVATTVGSGTPTIDESGRLIVEGTYSSLPRAQDVRTLVGEKHIRTTSVAFRNKKVTKGNQTRTVRELLNGAFVAIPSNTSAVVLESKGLGMKAGARNSASDAGRIQQIHDLALELGATTTDEDGDMDAKAFVGVKTVAGSYEQRQQALSDALDAAYPDPPDNGYVYAYPLATFDDTVVYRVSGDTDDRGQWQASYTVGDDGTVTLGDPEKVNMVETVQLVGGTVPKGYRLLADAPTNIGKSANAGDTEQSGTETHAAESAAAPEGAAAESAADDQAESDDIQLRAARIRAYAALAS